MSSPYDSMTANMLKAWGGQYGVTVIADTAAHAAATGTVFAKVVAKGATVVDTLAGNWSANPGALADGEAIYGRFTSITLTSGEVYAYVMKTSNV